MNLRPLVRFLGSMPFGLTLFGLVGLASALGSFFPTAEGWYQSWWFLVLLAALVLNTGFCTFRQVGWLVRGPGRRRVLFFVHASVLFLALACSWAALTFRSEPITLVEGQPFMVAGEPWTLQTAQVERYADGAVSDWVSTVVTPRGTAAIRVNQPAEWGASKVLQSGYQVRFVVRLDVDGQVREVELDQDVEAPLTADGAIGFAVSPPQEGLLASAQDGIEVLKTADLMLTSKGRILQKTAVFVGVPLQLGVTGLTLTVVSSQPRSTLLIRTAPGLGVVWLAFLVLASSITVLMLLPRPEPKEIPHA